MDKRAKRLGSVYNIFLVTLCCSLDLDRTKNTAEAFHPGREGNPALDFKDVNAPMRMVERPAFIGRTLLESGYRHWKIRLTTLTKKSWRDETTGKHLLSRRVIAGFAPLFCMHRMEQMKRRLASSCEANEAEAMLWSQYCRQFRSGWYFHIIRLTIERLANWRREMLINDCLKMPVLMSERNCSFPGLSNEAFDKAAQMSLNWTPGDPWADQSLQCGVPDAVSRLKEMTGALKWSKPIAYNILSIKHLAKAVFAFAAEVNQDEVMALACAWWLTNAPL